MLLPAVATTVLASRHRWSQRPAEYLLTALDHIAHLVHPILNESPSRSLASEIDATAEKKTPFIINLSPSIRTSNDQS